MRAAEIALPLPEPEETIDATIGKKIKKIE